MSSPCNANRVTLKVGRVSDIMYASIHIGGLTDAHFRGLHNLRNRPQDFKYNVVACQIRATSVKATTQPVKNTSDLVPIFGTTLLPSITMLLEGMNSLGETTSHNTTVIHPPREWILERLAAINRLAPQPVGATPAYV